ncbi:PD-(D/E)XK motif protein [Mycolicibacterium palauense]|uniref:PD-(D/E)XK motif protein n=1 Tax=Mycolicibacterium palauense TaxID=2034511 RepID=UPI000BFED536|nr:PD-(D/E)XK motif protein [Mycolicibacterium palauense]
MIDDVRLAYAALAAHGVSPHEGLTVLPIPAIDGAYVAVDDESRQHLLLATGGVAPTSADVTTLALDTRELVVEGRRVRLLDVTCLLAALSDVFDHFAAAVLERWSKAGEPAERAVSAVLEAWKEFLVPPTRLPGPNKVAATVGELLVVRDVVEKERSANLEFWLGPFGQRHDLRRGRVAVEVKTTRSHTGYQVSVHGDDQLVPPDSGALYLHFVRLEEVPGGSVTLPLVVDDLLAAGVSAHKLYSALTASGISAVDLAALAGAAFEIRERITLRVDERIPRIVPQSFVDGRRPRGVVDIAYVVDLSDAVRFAIEANEYEGLLQSLAVGEGS